MQATTSSPQETPGALSTERFVHRSEFPFSADAVYEWHTRPGAFSRCTPPFVPVRLIRANGSLAKGEIAEFKMRIGGLWKTWIAEFEEPTPKRQFVDVQKRGPFALWRHVHKMEPIDDKNCWLEDNIEYAPPLGALGRLLVGGRVANQLTETFLYRHETTRQDMLAHERSGLDRWRFAISGSSGLVGTELIPFLTTGGHEVLRLVRHESGKPDEIAWNPDRGVDRPDRLEGIDAIVHLAGVGIADQRWSVKQKDRIYQSRVEGTRNLCKSLTKLSQPPRVLVCASAIGIYGDRGDELLDEDSAHDDKSFLAHVCRDWEAATQPARDAGIRVVNVRFSMILTPRGGALEKMLLPAKMGAGGRMGSGTQWWSWVSIDDVLGAILHACAKSDLYGPVLVSSPSPVTSLQFAKTLGHVLHRPAIAPFPAFAARIAFGEMANELLLSSARVTPRKLLDSEYLFRQPNLEACLRHLLGRRTG